MKQSTKQKRYVRYFIDAILPLGAIFLLFQNFTGTFNNITKYTIFNTTSQLRTEVYRSETYNHAATVARFNGTIYVAWNGNMYNSSEGQAGQVIMLSKSTDNGLTWSKPEVPFVADYRAFTDMTNPAQARAADKGNADDNHKIWQWASREWQPSLVVFNNQLTMFWNLDRSTAGSALMMSTLESDGEQWLSHELHFQNGTPYMFTQFNQSKTTDPATLTIQHNMAAAYPLLHNAAAIPETLNIVDIPQSYLTAENNPPSKNAVTMPVSLLGQQMMPMSNHATVLKDKNGNSVLAIAAIFVQTMVDFDNLAVKIPALITTADGSKWNISFVPLKAGAQDYLANPRGDIGMVSAWEPTIFKNTQGQVEMIFRNNLPPVSSTNNPVSSSGYRLSSALGTDLGNFVIDWSTAKVENFDVPTSRASMTQLINSGRFVMAANNNVEGMSYDANGVPQYINEKYEPWARQNIALFFGQQGTSDLVSGMSISNAVEIPNQELVHYPHVFADLDSHSQDELLIAFSSHRRASPCVYDNNFTDCSDSIQFERVNNLPDANSVNIYPNHFAKYFGYNGTPQTETYSYSSTANSLVLVNRGSAGIETRGEAGCIDMNFKINTALAVGDSRPVISFGRSADRTKINGLRVVHYADAYALALGSNRIPGAVTVGTMVATQVCYDYLQKTLTAGGVTYSLGSTFSRRAYLGDDTLAAPAASVYPDIVFDTSSMSLEY